MIHCMMVGLHAAMCYHVACNVSVHCAGVEQVRCSLQLVTSTSCPKFHADFVTLRALCTYAGPGTMFVDER